MSSKPVIVFSAMIVAVAYADQADHERAALRAAVRVGKVEVQLKH